MIAAISIFAVVIVVLALMKLDFIVFDRNVFYFQISHIERRGEILNTHEYRALLNYVEGLFERDPESFGADPRIEVYNEMLAAFHKDS